MFGILHKVHKNVEEWIKRDSLIQFLVHYIRQKIK